MSAADTTADPNRTRAAGIMSIAGLAAILAGGFVYGQFTHRWGGGANVDAAVQNLDNFPTAFGPWREQVSEPMEANVLETLQCSGYVNRVYINVDTGEEVRVAVIVGPAGPTAVHSPEICFSSRSYNVEEEPEKESIEGSSGTHTFWRMKLRSRQPGGPRLIVYYAWTDAGLWSASDAPRFEFGGSPYLLKIQLAGAPKTVGKPAKDDLCFRFLRDLVDSEWTPGEASI